MTPILRRTSNKIEGEKITIACFPNVSCKKPSVTKCHFIETPDDYGVVGKSLSCSSESYLSLSILLILLQGVLDQRSGSWTLVDIDCLMQLSHE